MHDESSEEYERGWRAGYRDGQRWVLVLDDYQRDNLLLVLNLLGEPNAAAAVEPFDMLNTGEWVSEIAAMLAAHGTEAAFQMIAEKTGDPDLTRDDVLVAVNEWVAGLL